MALVVGNIANNPAAESPISVADANAYHTARGNAGWTGDDAAKEARLRNAGDYIRYTYATAWNAATLASVAVPGAMAAAGAQLALAAASGPLLSGYARGKKRVKVGPIEVEYDGNSPVQQVFPLAARMLSGLIVGISGNCLSLVRA